MLTGILAPLLGLGPSVSLLMLAGAALVIVSLLLYANPPGGARVLSSPTAGRRTV